MEQITEFLKSFLFDGWNSNWNRYRELRFFQRDFQSFTILMGTRQNSFVVLFIFIALEDFATRMTSSLGFIIFNWRFLLLKASPIKRLIA